MVFRPLVAQCFHSTSFKTHQSQFDCLSPADDSIPAKILSYNRANRAVALLCNHQRAPPKTFEKSMQNLQAKVNPHGASSSASSSGQKAPLPEEHWRELLALCSASQTFQYRCNKTLIHQHLLTYFNHLYTCFILLFLCESLFALCAALTMQTPPLWGSAVSDCDSPTF